MITSKEFVKNVVHFKGDERTPILYLNRDVEKSDARFVSYSAPNCFVPKTPGESEWGFVWESLDGTMGQPKNPPLKNGYSPWKTLNKPNPHDASRFANMKDFVQRNKEKYLIGGLGITGFNILMFIRGTEETMEDLYLNPDELMTVFEDIINFETGIIENYCKEEYIDCVSFGDDWGTQNTLMIDPEMFRKFFKPYYKKQFDIIKSYGKDVYFHSCGQVKDILDDLIEIGVDIFNLNQPDIFPLPYLEKYKGKVCFNCPVDHQTVAINGTRDEIFEYVSDLKKYLSNGKGGLIANIEEYKSVGMSEENYLAICEAFEKLRRGE